jgi:hypothetical protein
MEVRKFRGITLTADIVILAVSFLAMVMTKPSSIKGYLPSHSIFFAALAVVWIVVSLLNGKMHRGKIVNYSSVFYRVISSNIIALSITALLMYAFREYFYSRTIVLGTAASATLLELITGVLYISYKRASVTDSDDYQKFLTRKKSERELVKEVNGKKVRKEKTFSINPGILGAIEKESGKEIAEAIGRMISHKLSELTAVLSTTTVFNINSLPEPEYEYIINLRKINDIQNIDEFLEAVNAKLLKGGYLFCCVETKDQRKKRLLRKYPPVLNYIYYALDFIVKRIMPKLKLTAGLYYILTRGSNTVISRAEVLGRISRAGFRIKQESFIGKLLYIEAIKYSEPVPIEGYPYGPLIALQRIGKDRQLIKVYKLRTMHPYSEFIQEYIYSLHDLQNGGKFRDDFRITSWGAICRRIWLDELPMMINLLKGNMKLVGVRPLSRQYFSLYREEVRERRINYKPGLIPPFYADLPEDLDGIQASELNYLDSFDRHPFFTDFRYFWKSVWNIIFRYARSG